MSEAASNPPIHAVEVRISIGCHSWAGVQAVLEELLDELARRNCLNAQASVGWSGSHLVTVALRDVTAEQYRDELEAWRSRDRSSKQGEDRIDG